LATANNASMSPPLLHSDPTLTLKSTPPRAIRGFLDRERLKLERVELSGSRITALLAPTGFGRTAQLGRWCRDALARGSLAFWYSVDERDDPLRLVQGLVHCARSASGKRGFSESFMQWIAQRTDPQEALTGWLAEVAQLSIEVLLLLDDVELMPAASRTQVLIYLLGNAPPNLHVALTARSSGALLASGALTLAAVTRVTASDLRFNLDETISVLSTALGARCNPEAGVRLHEITEGWPLGVQLAIGALNRGGDLESLLEAATSDIQRYFLDAVIDRQSSDATQLLVRLSRCPLLHPQLGAAVLGEDRFSAELLRLQEETPLLIRAEGESWMRLHSLAREVLQQRFARLPAAEQSKLARAASAWYADHELFEEAADQSFLAGDAARAVALVEESAQRMTVQGRSTAVLAWYRRLSPKDLKGRPGFWGPAAWALAMGDRHDEAQPLVDLILSQPNLDPTVRFEAALIGNTMAAFADRPERMAQLVEPWPEPPPQARQDIVPIHLIAQSTLALYQGKPDQTRLLLARISRLDTLQSYSPVSYGFAAFGTGLSYLWEGRVALAEQVLRPSLTRAEDRLQRYHPVACMLAALLAQACWEIGRDDDATGLLTGRLDALERHGLPDAWMAAYKTLARVAERDDRQDQALDLLETLRAIGQSRGMIRPQALAMLEIVRLHARHGRADIATSFAAQLEALVRGRRTPIPGPFAAWLELHAELARARAGLAHEDGKLLPQVLQAAEAAASLATSLKRTGDLIEARLLCAEALRRRGAADASSVHSEALSLAQAEGMVRLLREHGARRDAAPEVVAPVKDTAPIALPGPTTGLLTGKEREVLTLLSRNLSNKEIAAAMNVGDQTVKWHVKNVFNKLNAASRKHAVARARMLGLVDS
jgi:LuxR family maltose regulon positive regulatory protein